MRATHRIHWDPHRCTPCPLHLGVCSAAYGFTRLCHRPCFSLIVLLCLSEICEHSYTSTSSLHGSDGKCQLYFLCLSQRCLLLSLNKQRSTWRESSDFCLCLSITVCSVFLLLSGVCQHRANNLPNRLQRLAPVSPVGIYHEAKGDKRTFSQWPLHLNVHFASYSPQPRAPKALELPSIVLSSHCILLWVIKFQGR